jgi:hypothetical protein
MASAVSKGTPDPWRIHFFQRDAADDPKRDVPAMDFLESIPPSVAAEIHAVLDAVAAAPPHSFSGGGKWEAMHGDMAGYYEVRVQGGGMNHRLFCVLERDAEDPRRVEHRVHRWSLEAEAHSGAPEGLQTGQALRRRVPEAADRDRVVEAFRRRVGRISRSRAPASATRVLSVGFGFSAEKRRRIASGFTPARRASSAFVRCSSSRRASKARITKSICSMRSRASS